MRVAIVGLGGVGAYLAANFTKSGIDVVGFARAKHLEAIQKESLTIIEDTTQYKVKLNAVDLNAANGYFDVVIFCVKSYDLKDAYQKIQKNIDKNSILLSFSNGINNGDTLKKLSDSIVVDACIYILSHIEKAGVIRKKGKVFAAVFGSDNQNAVKVIENLFQKANLRYKIAENIRTALWKKYIFIAAFATLTSYYDKSIGYIYEHHYKEAENLLKEIAKFAKENEGVDIYDEVQKALETAAKVPYDSSTSMHLDFKNNKNAELDTLSGYVKTPLMSNYFKELKSRRKNTKVHI